VTVGCTDVDGVELGINVCKDDGFEVSIDVGALVGSFDSDGRI
jgi:hypothetical protein